MPVLPVSTVEPASVVATDYDLAITGGGIVGATLAAALGSSGLRVAILEARPLAEVAARQRAYALSVLSSRIFSAIGVWDEILPQIGQFRQIRISDEEYPDVVQFQLRDLGTDALGYVGEHGVILNALYRYLDGCPQVTWHCPAEVLSFDRDVTGVTVQLKTPTGPQSLRARLLVGADGPRSHLRQLAAINTRGWRYWQSCLTFTIRHQQPQNDTAFERFWASGPMGVLPLPDNRCQVVWTAPHAEAEQLRDLEASQFLAKLEQRTGGLLGKLDLVGDRRIFPVQLMQSDHYVQSRFALIGDAAHCCHPVGGQGLNLGIRDAAALAQVLQAAAAQGQDLGDLAILRQYERWRQRENWLILGFTDLLDRLFSNRWLPIVAARRFGLGLLRRVPPLRRFALRLMTGLLGRQPLREHPRLAALTLNPSQSGRGAFNSPAPHLE
ncbi:MAG: FAD-dependent hydroxylase [Spirulinaceae cyanobacterium SM2_1_0]|nr:FAD-dependent hydroxylase [Spirulinaceae cyanobacterium SM2_1_0]